MALMMTLLLVVGCDVSPVLSKDLVNAKIDIESDKNFRSLNFEVNADVVRYEYVLIPLFEHPDGSDRIVGVVGNVNNGVISGWKELPEDGALGFVTQGKWKILIRALSDKNQELFVSEREVFFNNSNNTTTMMLQPSGDGNTLTISLDQQFLSENIYEYNYLYILDGISDPSIHITGKLTLDEANISEYSGNYSAKIQNLNAGYYSIRFLQYKNSGATGPLDEYDIWYGIQIGGKGVFISLYGSQEKTISGVIDPSEFVEAFVDMNELNVVTSLSVEQNSSDPRVCNFVLKDDTIVPEGYSVIYKWYVNSTEVSNANADPKVFSFTFEKYGKKNVSCIAVYTKTIGEKTFSSQGRAFCEFEVNPSST